MNLNATNYT